MKVCPKKKRMKFQVTYIYEKSIVKRICADQLIKWQFDFACECFHVNGNIVQYSKFELFAAEEKNPAKL